LARSGISCGCPILAAISAACAHTASFFRGKGGDFDFLSRPPNPVIPTRERSETGGIWLFAGSGADQLAGTYLKECSDFVTKPEY
jgi:hypothetical protein